MPSLLEQYLEKQATQSWKKHWHELSDEARQKLRDSGVLSDNKELRGISKGNHELARKHGVNVAAFDPPTIADTSRQLKDHLENGQSQIKVSSTPDRHGTIHLQQVSTAPHTTLARDAAAYQGDQLNSLFSGIVHADQKVPKAKRHQLRNWANVLDTRHEINEAIHQKENLKRFGVRHTTDMSIGTHIDPAVLAKDSELLAIAPDALRKTRQKWRGNNEFSPTEFKDRRTGETFSESELLSQLTYGELKFGEKAKLSRQTKKNLDRNMRTVTGAKILPNDHPDRIKHVEYHPFDGMVDPLSLSRDQRIENMRSKHPEVKAAAPTPQPAAIPRPHAAASSALVPSHAAVPAAIPRPHAAAPSALVPSHAAVPATIPKPHAAVPTVLKNYVDTIKGSNGKGKQLAAIGGTAAGVVGLAYGGHKLHQHLKAKKEEREMKTATDYLDQLCIEKQAKAKTQYSFQPTTENGPDSGIHTLSEQPGLFKRPVKPIGTTNVYNFPGAGFGQALSKAYNETMNGQTTTIDGRKFDRAAVEQYFDQLGQIQTYRYKARKPLLIGRKHWQEMTDKPLEHRLTGAGTATLERMHEDAKRFAEPSYKTWQNHQGQPAEIIHYAHAQLDQLCLYKLAFYASK